METIKIDKTLYGFIAEQSKISKVEICGLGFDSSGDEAVDRLSFCKNYSKIPGAEYQFNPDDYGTFIQYHMDKKKDKKLVMIFHSHPLWKAFPSIKDVEKAYPKYIYLIYSCIEDKARAFKVDETAEKKAMYEIPLEIN